MHKAQPRFARRSTPFSMLGALVVASALLFGGAQAATAAPAQDQAIDQHSISASASSAAAEYWTPSKMEAAQPLDAIADEAAVEAAVAETPVETGTPTKIQGHAAAEVSSTEPNRRVAAAPISHVGKVFFTLGGQNWVCSGNAVVSANESTVSTAGHCLNEGPGAYATNWVFVPAYDNGATPYGVWTATELVAPSAWANQGNINYDTGFAVVSNSSGATLTDTVGASGVAFNQARGLSYTAYGYPAGAPFNGETLHTCAGTAQNDIWGGSNSQGIPCDMTGGSSGGPWFIGTGSNGLQNSVNSFGYDGLSNMMFGPYWGTVIEDAYQLAES